MDFYVNPSPERLLSIFVGSKGKCPFDCARQYNFSGCFVCIYSFRLLTGTVWVCSFPLSQEHLLREIANQQKHFKTGFSWKKVTLAFIER